MTKDDRMHPHYTTIQDAKTDCHSVLDYDWGDDRDGEQVLEQLAKFAWNEDLTVTEALPRFVVEVLGDNAADHDFS